MSIRSKNRCTCSPTRLLTPGQPHEEGCAEAPCSSCAQLKTKCDDLAYQLENVTLHRDQVLSAWKSGYPMWYYDSRATTTGPDKQEYTPPESRPVLPQKKSWWDRWMDWIDA